MRWRPERLKAFLEANTAAAERLLPIGAQPSRRDLTRLHLARGGLLDHLLACWLAPLTLGLSAWLWKHFWGSCRFAGFIDRAEQRVGCLIHPLRLGSPKDLRRHAFPLIPTLNCDRALRCPMLETRSVPPAADWLEASRAGARSLQRRRPQARKRTCG